MNLDILKYDIVPVYRPLMDDNHFVKILYGSRNSAKSDFACLKMIADCLELDYFKCLMVRRVKEAVHESIYSKIKSVCVRHGIEHLFTFKDHTSKIYCNVNNNMFLPLGTYETVGSTGKAKSVNDPTHAIIDEMDELTKSEYNKLVLSLRGAETKGVIGIFNTHSVDENHWIFKRWFPPLETFEKKDGTHTYIPSKRKNTIILHTTYKHNPFVNADIIQEFEDQKEFDYEDYEIDGLGLIRQRKESNLALKYFNRKRNIDANIKLHPTNIVYLAWDFNRLPHHTVSLWQFGGSDQNNYYWNMVKEFCLPDHSIKEVQKEINKWLKSNGYVNNSVTIVCDYSGNTKRDHDSISDINKIKSQLKADGFAVRDRTIVNAGVVSSLDFLNDMLGGLVTLSKRNPKYGGAVIRIRLHPSCIFHIADFEKTKTDRAGKLLKVTKKDVFLEDGIKVSRSYQARGHGVDNSRYMATAIFNFEYLEHKSNK